MPALGVNGQIGEVQAPTFLDFPAPISLLFVFSWLQSKAVGGAAMVRRFPFEEVCGTFLMLHHAATWV
jgi:hypothetical protein